MSGPKRNPDKLNTIGVVVVGICGAVMVYVTIVALQAFYINDTSEIQTMADYGGQDKTAKGHKADEVRNITEPATNPVAPGTNQTFRIKIEDAMKLVVDDAKKDPAHLIPALPKSEKATIEPVFGRPKAAAPAPTAPAQGSGATTAAPQTSTGTAGEPQPVAGAGGTPSPPPSGGAPVPAASGSNAPPAATQGAPNAATPTTPATTPKRQPQPKQPKKAGPAGAGEPKTP